MESAPTWIQQPESHNVYENETVIIHCSASGDPEPTIQWFIDGISVAEVPENPRRIVETNSITFVDVVMLDTCVIQCNAVNRQGEIFTNAYLNVQCEYLFFL